jgi:glycosyltransferase involved in cell wall biosynthesis
LEGVELCKVHRKLSFLLPKSKVWHITHQDSKYLPLSGKKILTIHDLNFIFENGDDFKKCKRYLRNLQNIIDRVDIVVCISKTTKKIVEQNFDLKKKRVEVIYNGIPLHFDLAEKIPKFINASTRFLFSIGTVVPKKNFHVLIELMKGVPELQLIIAGPNFHKYAQDLIKQIKLEGLEDRILIPGKVSEAEKLWLYKNCEAFLFPSLLEGFGQPVVEAMSLKKPLFLSNIEVLKEIGGEDAFYFDRYDTVSMKEVFEAGMKRYKEDDEFKDRLFKRSQQYSFEKAANSYKTLYEELLK